MKKINYLYIMIILLLFNSCETVVILDIKDDKERLVIEAVIKWEKGSLGNNQTIKLSKTNSFYNTKTIPAINAIVSIDNNNGTTFNFTETTDGIYITNNFIPELNVKYQLKIEYNNEVYIANETLLEGVKIKKITQTLTGGDSDNEPEINVFFDDKKGVENFYRISYNRTITNGNITNEFGVTTYDDQFEDGNELTDFNEYENIFTNDVFEISLQGISKRFYNYLSSIDQQGDAGFNPFAAPPVNVFGNCVNITNKENYPYGYFSLGKIDTKVYVWK